MCYDISASNRDYIKKNEKRMHEIEKEKPQDFFTDKEWRKLVNENRIYSLHIQDYERKIRIGAKF
jgi:hypothetical protein